MKAEREKRPSIWRQIDSSPAGWAASTTIVLMSWRVAVAICGLAEQVEDKSGRLYDSFCRRLDEISSRRMTKLIKEKKDV